MSEEKNWSIPVGGVISVPDYLDPLVNSIGTQYRLHTISKRFGEAEFVCRVIYRAEQFFKKKKDEELEAFGYAMAEGAQSWQQEYDNARAILCEISNLKIVKGFADTYKFSDETKAGEVLKRVAEFLNEYQHQ